MVATVYKRNYGPHGMEHEVLMKLKDDFSGACRVSGFYQGETAYGRDNIYEDELTIGNERYDYIVIRGQVIHNIVRSVMRGVSKKAKQDMIEHLKYLIEEDEQLKSNRG